MSMNIAHDLDKADNDAIVANGSHWMISSNISTGNVERVIWDLVGVGADQRSGKSWVWWSVVRGYGVVISRSKFAYKAGTDQSHHFEFHFPASLFAPLLLNLRLVSSLSRHALNFKSFLPLQEHCIGLGGWSFGRAGISLLA